MVILQAIQDFGNWFWGIPILILIGGGGLFLTIYLGFPQILSLIHISEPTRPY